MSQVAVEQVRAVLQRLQDAYVARDEAQLDAVMELFDRDDVEMIGIGASKREGYEWFNGWEAVREIVKGDWEFWGDVSMDLDEARIRVCGDCAWVSLTARVVQSQQFDEALPFFLETMGKLLQDEERTIDDRLVEATHYGMRRVRERAKGIGHPWPLVITAVLVNSQGSWRFRALHWSMPVD